MIIDGKKEFLEELINNISDGAYFLNPDRVINFWNQGAEKITGYQKNDALGKKCAHSFLDVHTAFLILLMNGEQNSAMICVRP